MARTMCQELGCLGHFCPKSDHPSPGSPWPEAPEEAPREGTAPAPRSASDGGVWDRSGPAPRGLGPIDAAEELERRAYQATAEAPGRPAIAPGPLPTSAGMVDQGSARLNAGKPPLHLAPLDGLVLVSWVGAFGAEKYSQRGWEQAAAEGRFSWSDCVRALLSHTLKLMVGQRDDSESGLPHVGHIAWNALALCSMLVRGNGLDDLPGPARGAPVPLEPGEWAPGEAFHRAVAEVRARKRA